MIQHHVKLVIIYITRVSGQLHMIVAVASQRVTSARFPSCNPLARLPLFTGLTLNGLRFAFLLLDKSSH